jgi:hypothetical protein
MTLEKIEEIRRKRIKTYHVLDFTLDSARDNEALHITGSYIYVLNLDGACSIRLNETSSDSIDFLKFRVINSPFYRFFLTHPAQAGKILKLAVGVESEFFSLQDFQSPDLALLTGYGQELRNNFSYNYGTQVAKSNSANNNTVIIHTVSVGKILLLETWSVSYYLTSGAATGSMTVRDAGDVTQYTLNQFGQAAVGGVFGSSSGLIFIPEGYDLCVTSAAVAQSVLGFIKGREV